MEWHVGWIRISRRTQQFDRATGADERDQLERQVKQSTPRWTQIGLTFLTRWSSFIRPIALRERNGAFRRQNKGCVGLAPPIWLDHLIIEQVPNRGRPNLRRPAIDPRAHPIILD
jgi:hypothetical protein